MWMKTTALLNKVKEDYNEIASEFSETRKRPWPEFELFKKYADSFGPKAKILDVGCGNGRLAHALHTPGLKLDYVGVDNSTELIKLAKELNPEVEFKHGDILEIPCPDKSFDIVFAIAVLHHVPSKKLQLQAMSEIKRVLKKGGIAIVTAWNLWEQKKYEDCIDKKTHDSLIPWGDSKKVKRFYHAFTAEELAELISESGLEPMQKKIRKSHNFIFVCYEKN